MLFEDDKKPVWINPQVLQWLTFSQGGSEPDVSIRLRAYEMWSHAEKLLSHATSDLQVVDVITILKRSIDHRLRALNSIYTFKDIPVRSNPSELLSLLEFFDIVRPLMFRNLLDIRNAVEHEDAAPPEIKTTQVFLEFTWYFLRSTDRLLQLVANNIALYPSNEDEDYYWLDFEYGPTNLWNPSLRGWISANLFATHAIENWIVLYASRVETVDELQGTAPNSNTNERYNRPRKLGDAYLHGDVRGSENALTQLTKIYFSAV
jgi:hypothetical protein